MLLLLVLWKTPSPELLIPAFRSALGWELLLATALNFAVVGLKVWRWQRLLLADGVAYAFVPAWRAFNAASYLALLTPGRVGDLLRVSYLRRDAGVPLSRALASVVLDRVFDVLVLGACAALGLVWFGSLVSQEVGTFSRASIAALAGACLAALLLLASARSSEWLVHRVLGRIVRTPAPGQFVAAARTALSGAWPSALALTSAAFALVYAQAYLVARGLGAPLSLLDVVALNALTTLFGLLPFSISGVGVRELLLAVLFPALGLSATLGVAYGLLIFGILYLPMVLYGKASPYPVRGISRDF
jgi:uncharacterized protein (TIRG00374 family)